MFKTITTLFTDKVLIKKFLAVIIGLLFFRLLTSIPIPQIDVATLETLLAQNQLLGVFNVFSGGGLSNFSIAMLGVFPYITVSIVVQLLTAVSPRIHSMYHEEGDIGRKKIGQWTRIATLPVALINSIGILTYFKSQGVLPFISNADFVLSVILIATGSMIAMWVGELITEFGIGNGVSFIVFAGIVVNAPTLIVQAISAYTPSLTFNYILGGVGILVGLAIAVWMNEGDRPVPVTYARYGISHGKGERKVETYIPIKVNPVGVLPIIFSLTIGAFFQFIFTFMSNSSISLLQSVGEYFSVILANGYYYAIPIILLTVFFTYFHAPIVFNTEKLATNIQKQGAFVLGVRPGQETISYFDRVLKHIIFYAAIFLCVVSAIPYLVTGSTTGTFLFAIGGTGAMIIVSVVLDVYQKTISRVNDLAEV